tara:strand:- start:5389 stop:5694 length:306 start_codon:yes stop_codon:yes gene_type:complete
MSDTEVKQKIRPILNELEPPKDYKIIYLNDNVTTFQFVTESLMGTFSYESTDADQKAMEINERGSGVVAQLPFEVAEQKGVEVLLSARNQGYPLEIKLESN